MARRARGSGGVFKPKESRFWWVSYYSGGKRHAESTKSERKTDAVELLRTRLGDISRGVQVTPKVGRVTIGEALQAVIDDQRVNGRRSIADTQRRIDLHLLTHFVPERRMVSIMAADITAYVRTRLDGGAAPATVNRDLATLRRAFRLAMRDGTLLTMPHVQLLAEHNVRQGFFERAQLDDVLKRLPGHLQPPILFGYVTGWRMRSEVQPLTVPQVDLDAGVVRLEPGTTKSDRGRQFALTTELRELLANQLASAERLKREGIITPFVFHKPDGRPIKSFYGAWRRATREAGYPGRVPHDFRRSAVRNLDRAGVPRSTAMSMVGHVLRPRVFLDT